MDFIIQFSRSGKSFEKALLLKKFGKSFEFGFFWPQMCCTPAVQVAVLSADRRRTGDVWCSLHVRVSYSHFSAAHARPVMTFICRFLLLALDFDSLKLGQQDGEVLSHSDEFAGEDEAVFSAEMDTSYVNVSSEPPLEADLNLRRGTLVV